jgi:hypothetical protein
MPRRGVTCFSLAVVVSVEYSRKNQMSITFLIVVGLHVFWRCMLLPWFGLLALFQRGYPNFCVIKHSHLT